MVLEASLTKGKHGIGRYRPRRNRRLDDGTTMYRRCQNHVAKRRKNSSAFARYATEGAGKKEAVEREFLIRLRSPVSRGSVEKDGGRPSMQKRIMSVRAGRLCNQEK